MLKKIFLIGSLLTYNLLIADNDFPIEEVEVVQVQDNHVNENNIDQSIESLKIEMKRKHEKGEVETKKEIVINFDNLELGESDFGGSQKEDFINVEEISNPINELSEREMLSLKKYSSIHYVKGYDWFSLYELNEDYFNEIRNKFGISKYEFEQNKGTFNGSDEMIALNAFYFDYVEKRPDIAENYYLQFPKMKTSLFYGKILLADYMIRTNRSKIIPSFLKKSACVGARVTIRNSCLYYLGVSEYLRTKNNKNYLLNLVRGDIPKANLIYKKRKRKK